MSEKSYGEQLFDKLAKERGLSKSRVYKILALQRLCDEVRALGDEGKLREGVLLEISKIDSPARQKMLADLVLAQGLTVDQTRQLARVIRSAEKSTPEAANAQWDAFLDLEEAIEAKGMTEALSSELRQLAGRAHVVPDPAPESAPDVSADLPSPVMRAPAEAADASAEAPGATAESHRGVGARRAKPEAPPLQVPRPGLVEFLPGRGLDVGTTNIVAAGRIPDGERQFILQRNAFLDVRNDAFTKRMLFKLGIDHVMHENRMYVIGDPAFELANIFEKETRRPMKDGLVSPQETEALQMVNMIIRLVLGPPGEDREIIAFSVPAEPIDVDRNVIYHRGALEAILRRYGYTPRPAIEGYAVVLTELDQEDYTGIGISCGGGMFNVCVAYKSVPAITFSTSRGGDWVDVNVGKSLGIPASQATAIKEGGIDLANPQTREEEAICIYYRELIHYTLTTIKRQMESARSLPTFSRPVELVCAGGTALVRGFIPVFEEEYRKVHFPLEVSRIRLARDPLRTVAEGCLTAAQEETQARAAGWVAAASPSFGSAKVSAAPVTLPEKLPSRRPYAGEERRKKAPETTSAPLPARRPAMPPVPLAPGDADAQTALPPIRKLPPAPTRGLEEESEPSIERTPQTEAAASPEAPEALAGEPPAQDDASMSPAPAPAEDALGMEDLTLAPAAEGPSPLPFIDLEPEAPDASNAGENTPSKSAPSSGAGKTRPGEPPDLSLPLIS